MGLLIRWILVLVLLMPARLRAVEVIDGPRVEAAGTTATVRWKLDAPAGGTVRFGLTEGALNRSEKSPVVATEHTVKLDGLQPGVRYHFSIGTARRSLKTGSFVAGMGPGPGAGGERPPTRGDASLRRGGSAGDAPSSAKEAPAALDSAAPPARRTWANVATLRDHYERHGRDFAATSAEDYAAQAWRFLQRAKTEGLPAKIDPEGTLRVWDPRTRSFAAYTRQGLTKTYFKPGSRDYFERQPGRPVRLQPGGGVPGAE
jgi:hypothetical protein